MNNREIEAAWTYHNGTKHPGGALMNPYHQYQPALDPLPFKIYEGLEKIPLPLAASPLGMPALAAIAKDTKSIEGEHIPDIDDLSRILYFSAGVTKKIEYEWGSMYFRAAACTGALYHIELYVVCGDLPGLAAGVYHYEPQAQALTVMRQGDYRRVLIEASGDEPAMEVAPAILMFSDVYWRNAVKYQAREYRHTYWDGGTILSHTLTVCAALDLPARVVMGFEDDAVNQLLSFDVEEEAAFALVPTGNGPEMLAPPAPERIETLNVEIMPIGGRTPVKFQPIFEMHEASMLHSHDEAAAWRSAEVPSFEMPEPQSELIPLSPSEPTDRDLSEVILHRGSTRVFMREPISFAQLSTLLRQSLQGVPTDYSGSLVTPYLIVNEVDGLEQGSYVYLRSGEALELLSAGNFRRQAGDLALGQDLAADAAVDVYFLTDLNRLIDAYGNRGYRASQLEAATEAGRMYLAAYAQKFGASGLTFFDDAVTRFFSPHAEGQSAMFLIALGHKAKRRSGL